MLGCIQQSPLEAQDNYVRFQHHPPDSFGIQNIFKEFPISNVVTENGKELYCPKGGKGFEGEPGVPPRCIRKELIKYFVNIIYIFYKVFNNEFNTSNAFSS